MSKKIMVKNITKEIRAIDWSVIDGLRKESPRGSTRDMIARNARAWWYSPGREVAAPA